MIKDLIADDAPIEEYSIKGKKVIVRREDLRYSAPLPPNAKMSALYEIVKREAANYDTMVLFAKKQQGTPYAIGFPYICQEFKVHPVIVYPANDKSKIPPSLQELDKSVRDLGVLIVHPNMVTVNVNQCKRIASDLNAYFIPFGFDDALSVDVHAAHFQIPIADVETVLMATMTGMTLAGAILNAQRQIIRDELWQKDIDLPMFIGVSCGRDPDNVKKAMNKYIMLPERLSIVNPYERNVKIKINTPLPLHPDYELKAWNWMVENIDMLKTPIYFVNVGR